MITGKTVSSQIGVEKKGALNCVSRFKMMLNEEKTWANFMVYMRRVGRITIPKELRDAFDLKVDNFVEC